MAPRRRRATGGTLGAAGWLFAELALLLVVVVIGSEAPAPRPEATPSGSSTPPSPTVRATTAGVSLKSVKFLLPVVADGDVAATFSRIMTERIGPDAHVGLVLLFGVSRTGDLADGAAVSARVKSLVEAVDIVQLRSRADIRAYIGGTDDGVGGEVLVELFLMNGPS